MIVAPRAPSLAKFGEVDRYSPSEWETQCSLDISTFRVSYKAMTVYFPPFAPPPPHSYWMKDEGPVYVVLGSEKAFVNVWCSLHHRHWQRYSSRYPAYPTIGQHSFGRKTCSPIREEACSYLWNDSMFPMTGLVVLNPAHKLQTHNSTVSAADIGNDDAVPLKRNGRFRAQIFASSAVVKACSQKKFQIHTSVWVWHSISTILPVIVWGQSSSLPYSCF